ncbi:MAG: hypothetical protein AAF318_17795 [Pseudomonadota bacterium]
MKLFLVGLWTVVVTLGAAYGVGLWRMDTAEAETRPRFEGLQYTSLPTMSVPVLESGTVQGYVVVRVVYTADTAVLRNIASDPDPFLSDEIFRTLYASAETVFGRLQRIDLTEFADGVKTRVNARLGDAVIQDLLVDGLNYIDLDSVDANGAPRNPALARALPTAASDPAPTQE